MCNGRETMLQLVKGLDDGAAAVNIRRSAETIGDFLKRKAFAKNVAARAGVLPAKVRGKCCWVDVFEIATSLPGVAHLTFKITRVRSSESGALEANQSTSRRMTSASSAEVSSWCCSIRRRMRVVPKNWPSLLAVSAMPSEWKTRMSPTSSVTPHSSY